MLQKLLLFTAGLALGVTVAALWPAPMRSSPLASDHRADPPQHLPHPGDPSPANAGRMPADDGLVDGGAQRTVDPSLQAALARIEARLERLEATLEASRQTNRRSLHAAPEGSELQASVAPVVAAVLAEQRALDEEREREERAAAQEQMEAERDREARIKAAHVARELGLSNHQRDLFADALATFSQGMLALQQNYATTDPDEWIRLELEVRTSFETRIRQDLDGNAAERILEWF